MVNDLRLPAEWEEQDGVMLIWLHDAGDWAPYLEQVEPVFVEIASEVAGREQLLVVCRNEVHRAYVQEL